MEQTYLQCPTKCNIPKDIIKTENKVLVIGDLHADYLKTINLLKHFKLIDEDTKWSGNNTIVVQLGDQIDGRGRGGLKDANGEIKILNLFDSLHEQAVKEGGAVYSLLGNHEIMNTMGNFKYASSKDTDNFGGVESRYAVFKPSKHPDKGCLSKKFSCTRNVFLKINDILFVHAGIVPSLTREHKTNTITFINKLMRNYLNGTLQSSGKELDKYFNYSNSVLWDRKLGGQTVNCEEVDTMLEDIGAKHIIIGHTPQSIINSKCNNKIWRVDVGLSRSLGDNDFQILEITKNKDSYNFKVLK